MIAERWRVGVQVVPVRKVMPRLRQRLCLDLTDAQFDAEAMRIVTTAAKSKGRSAPRGPSFLPWRASSTAMPTPARPSWRALLGRHPLTDPVGCCAGGSANYDFFQNMQRGIAI